MSDVEMINAVLRLWDVGMDTEQIAKVLQIKQHEVERFLHMGLGARRAEGKATDV